MKGGDDDMMEEDNTEEVYMDYIMIEFLMDKITAYNNNKAPFEPPSVSGIFNKGYDYDYDNTHIKSDLIDDNDIEILKSILISAKNFIKTFCIKHNVDPNELIIRGKLNKTFLPIRYDNDIDEWITDSPEYKNIDSYSTNMLVYMLNNGYNYYRNSLKDDAGNDGNIMRDSLFFNKYHIYYIHFNDCISIALQSIGEFNSDKDCEGKEDPVSLEAIPNGRGFRLEADPIGSSGDANCYDAETIRKIKNNKSPLTRTTFTDNDIARKDKLPKYN